MTTKHKRSGAADRPAYSSLSDKRRQTAAGRARRVLLYYITDRTQFPGDEEERSRTLIGRILHAARAHVDWIQLREKDLAPRALEELACDAVAAVREAWADARSHTRLLINSRTDIAIACGADGVHLRSGAGEISPADARACFDQAGVRRAVIGVSCHSREEVAMAAAQGADFAVFGPVFEKGPDAAGEPIKPAGLEALRLACEHSLGGMPVLALGGVELDNAGECLRAGAAGVAGIRVFQQGDVAETIGRLRDLRVET